MWSANYIYIPMQYNVVVLSSVMHSVYTNTNYIITTFYAILTLDLFLSDTQSLHKHKYYYCNLHDFITIACPV